MAPSPLERGGGLKFYLGDVQLAQSCAPHLLLLPLLLKQLVDIAPLSLAPTPAPGVASVARTAPAPTPVPLHVEVLQWSALSILLAKSHGG